MIKSVDEQSFGTISNFKNALLSLRAKVCMHWVNIASKINEFPDLANFSSCHSMIGRFSTLRLVDFSANLWLVDFPEIGSHSCCGKFLIGVNQIYLAILTNKFAIFTNIFWNFTNIFAIWFTFMLWQVSDCCKPTQIQGQTITDVTTS